MRPFTIVKISNIPVKDIASKIQEVSVDMNYYLPTMFTILILDYPPTIPMTLDNTDNVLRFSIGASVEITVYHYPNNSDIPVSNTLVKGEITSIEPIFDQGRTTLRIRGFDRGHRLTRGKATRTYGSGSPIGPGTSDSEIVTKIAQAHGLSPDISALKLTTVRYNYVMQYNQNDWNFLWSRASQLGYQVYVDNRKLCFKSADSKRSIKSPSKLIFGENLQHFEPVIDSMDQVTGASVSGWDPDLKKKVNASSKIDLNLSQTAIPGNLVPPGMEIKKAFSSKDESTIIDPAIKSIPQAKVMASAELSRLSSQYVRASGELSEGDPFLVAGSMVTITGLGVRFSGQYYVTEVRHTIKDGRYYCQFKVSGRNPSTFRSLILGSNEFAHENKIEGVVTGIVTSNSDPQNLGRVQVKYPWLPEVNGAELSSAWARLAIPGGGKNGGVLFTPEVDDEVLISFENGDMNVPYIIGVLYNKKDAPPKGTKALVDSGTKKVNQRIIVSRSGHKIILDDSSGEEKIIIQDKSNKNTITIDSKTNSMKLKSEGDFTIEAGGKLLIKSKGDFKIESSGKGEVSANSDLSVEGKQKAAVKSGTASLDLQASGAALKGTKVDVTANTQASVKGSAMVQIQGGIVKIN